MKTMKKATEKQIKNDFQQPTHLLDSFLFVSLGFGPLLLQFASFCVQVRLHLRERLLHALALPLLGCKLTLQSGLRRLGRAECLAHFTQVRVQFGDRASEPLVLLLLLLTLTQRTLLLLLQLTS